MPDTAPLAAAVPTIDLAGFLALLAGYGAWFAVRTHYWLPDALAAREVERALEAHVAANDAARRAANDDDATPPAPRRAAGGRR